GVLADLSELAGAVERGGRFWCAVASRRLQCLTVRELQPQPEEALRRSLGHVVGKLESFLQMRDRLDKSRAAQRECAGFAPPCDGVFREPSLREMVRHHFRLRFGHCREAVAYSFGNAPMHAASAVLGQALVRGILKQGVLEGVSGLRWLTFAEHELGLFELRKSRLHPPSLPSHHPPHQTIPQLAPP